MGKSRFNVFREKKVAVPDLLKVYKAYLQETKKIVPPFLVDIPKSEFKLELVSKKPWSAFNTHYAPFKSKLSINQDIPLNTHDLRHLSQHEAWGGHHSELSLKDELLTQKGRGEHGLVIVYSPQVFVSEAIAESMFDILGIKSRLDDGELLLWNYNRYIFALYNLVTFRYFDDNLSKQSIARELETYDIGQEGRKVVLNFSTDKSYGKYATIYYTAYNFMMALYNQTTNKDDFIHHVFNQPCTPSMREKNSRAKKYNVL